MSHVRSPTVKLVLRCSRVELPAAGSDSQGVFELPSPPNSSHVCTSPPSATKKPTPVLDDARDDVCDAAGPLFDTNWSSPNASSLDASSFSELLTPDESVSESSSLNCPFAVMTVKVSCTTKNQARHANDEDTLHPKVEKSPLALNHRDPASYLSGNEGHRPVRHCCDLDAELQYTEGTSPPLRVCHCCAKARHTL